MSKTPPYPHTALIHYEGGHGIKPSPITSMTRPTTSPPTLKHHSNEGHAPIRPQEKGQYGSDTRHPPIALTPTKGGSAASGSLLKRL